MAASGTRDLLASSPRAVRSEPLPGARRPAARAEARVSRAGLTLGSMGLGSALFVIARLLESWRVSAHAASGHVSILGQKLTYPAANADAILILLLASFGAIATVLAIAATARE